MTKTLRLGLMFCLSLILLSCQPAHVYQPLKHRTLDMGNSLDLTVFGSASWLDTGIQVRQGEVYRVSSSGMWSAGPFCGEVDANGLASEHLMCMKGVFAPSFPVPEGRIMALVGKIGANGKPFVIGGTQGFIADRPGKLFLRNNDPDQFLFDNTGQIQVAVQRYQEGVSSAKVTSRSSSEPRSVRKKTAKKAKIYGAGYFAAEEDIAFNVLEGVSFNTKTGELSIAGKFDPKYLGPRIPYLQHLATFLDNPGPQVSLDWTSEFERKVDNFFQRMDSELEMSKLVGAGQLIDNSGKLTPKGKLFLPFFGVKPHKQGASAGALGVETTFKETGVVTVSRVIPGSAAERAGLRVGDMIHMFTGPDDIPSQPHAPQTLVRDVRYAGAGANVKLYVAGSGSARDVHVTLDAYPGDPWEHVTKYDIKAKIFRQGGRSDVANTLQSLDKMLRLQDTPAGLDSLWFLLFHLKVGDWAEQKRQLVMKGQMRKQDFQNQLSRKIIEAMESEMHMSHGSMTSAYDRARARGIDGWSAMDVAILELNRQLEQPFKDALRTALRNNDQITLPVALLDPDSNFSPEVVPRYIGIPSDSELARLFIEADYIGKAIIHRPDLSQRIPGYQTEYAFAKRRNAVSGGVETTNRLWIEPARVEVRRSKDNESLRFGRTHMRVSIGRVLGANQEKYDDSYSRFLTGLYDDLAVEFPQLHELREAAKIAVVARWIKSRSPNFKLPHEGRARLTPPKKLEGFVTLIWSPNRVKVSLIAPGGIDFNVPPIGPSGPVFPDGKSVNVPVDTSVVDLSDSARDIMPSVDPKMFKTSTFIPAQYRRPLTAPPVPASTRLVALASKGKRKLSQIRALRTQTKMDLKRCDLEASRDLHKKLAHAGVLANKLKGVEDALNAITSQLPERNRTIKAVNKTLRVEQQRLHDGAMDLASGGLLGVYDHLKGSSQMRSIQDLETLIATMRQAKKKLGEISDEISNLDLTLSSAMASSLAERERAQKNLLVYLKDTLGDGAKIKGNDATSRALRTAGKTIGLAGKVNTALEGAESLYKLADAIQTLERLDAQSEKEVAGLRKTLLPLQRDLSDKLDNAMSDPLIRALQKGTGRFDCGSSP